MFTVDLKIKSLFFDRPAVRARVDRAKLATLRKAAGATRLRARRSLRRRQSPAPAGQPPHVHSRDAVANLRNILYGLEPNRDAVVIGPVKVNGKIGELSSRGTVPGLLELGGTGVALEKRVGLTWFPLGRRRPRPGQPVRRRTFSMQPRPFMRPALDVVAAETPNLFARSLIG